MTDETRTTEAAALLDVRQVAALMGVCPRTIYRLADSGAMPRPVHLGSAIVRWSRSSLDQWIGAGCPRTAPADSGESSEQISLSDTDLARLLTATTAASALMTEPALTHGEEGV